MPQTGLLEKLSNHGVVTERRCREREQIQENPNSDIVVLKGYFINRLNIKIAYTVYMPRTRQFSEVIVISPEMAVRPIKYCAFAMYLARRNTVITYAPSGTGESMTTCKGTHIKLTDWVNDLDGLVAFFADKYRRPIICIGHNVGGQLIGLINQANVKKAILIASQGGYWKNWGISFRCRMLFNLCLACLNALLFRNFKLANFFDQDTVPGGVSFDRIRWAVSEKFLDSNGKSVDCRFNRFKKTLLYIGASDNSSHASRKSGESLLRKFSHADKHVWTFSPQTAGIKKIEHAGFFMEHIGGLFWKKIADWIRI